MRNRGIFFLTILGVFFTASCDKDDADTQKEKNPINAAEFFQKNQIKPASLDINGDGNQDILICGFTTNSYGDINGDGNQDILITGIQNLDAKDINGDGNQDILITGDCCGIDIGGDGNQDILITGIDYRVVNDVGGDENQDILITVPPHAFLNPDGGSVTGKIQIEIALLPTKNDIIFSGLDTKTEEGALLNSSLMLYINATQDGKQLKINPEYLQHRDMGITVEIFNNGQPNENTALYVGMAQKDDGTGDAAIEFAWNIAENVLKVPVSDDGNKSSQFNLPSLGWFNIATPPFQEAGQTPITVNVEGKGLENIKDLDLWLVWEKKNVVLKLNPLDKGNDVWISTDNIAPIDETPILAIMGVNKEGNIVMGKAEIIIEENGVYTVIVE